MGNKEFDSQNDHLLEVAESFIAAEHQAHEFDEHAAAKKAANLGYTALIPERVRPTTHDKVPDGVVVNVEFGRFGN